MNEDGLEQWKPVLKAPFPISGKDVAAAFDALGVVAPALKRSAYSRDELVSELIAPSPALRPVEVHKHRERHTLGGCKAELSQISTTQGARQTIAVESEDPAAVIAVVRDLGLGSRRNVNLPRGLAALIGFGARRYAVVDVGTNSVKFHIGELDPEGVWTTVVDRAEVTRLGEGLEESGRFDDEATERTIEAIAAMADEARRQGVVAIAAVGTAGLRMAANTERFVANVRDRSGVEVEVISGEEEARLAYLAAGPRSGSSWAPSQCSTAAGAARSSPSATATRWTSSSA